MRNCFFRLFNQQKKYTNSILALSNINLSFKNGDRVGIIGANGSGKTTLLRVIAGIYQPTRGSILVNGRVTSFLDISTGMDFEATGYENIKIRCLLMGVKTYEINKIKSKVAEFSGLGDFLNLPIKTYSSGRHMRLSFSIITEVPADIVLMDEWLSVGDSEFVRRAEEKLLSYLKNTSILVIATHSRDTLNKVTNKVIDLGASKVISNI